MSNADILVFVAAANRNERYADFVSKLFKVDTDIMEMCHLGMAIPGEAGELADAIKRHTIYGNELDMKNVVEEIGDIAFFLQALMTKLGLNWADVLQANAVKLNKRYSSGTYKPEDAIARLDKMVEAAEVSGAESKPLNWGLSQEQQGE